MAIVAGAMLLVAADLLFFRGDHFDRTADRPEVADGAAIVAIAVVLLGS